MAYRDFLSLFSDLSKHLIKPILTLGQWADLLLQPVLIAAVLGVLVGCILYAFIDWLLRVIAANSNDTRPHSGNRV